MARTGATFNHAMVYTRDLARSLDFYVGHLGLELLEIQPPYYARLRSARGDQTLALHVRDPKAALDPTREGVRLYFEVRNLDRFCQRLTTRGVRFLQPPTQMPWGWRHAYLRDPDRHEISLYWAGSRRLAKGSGPGTTAQTGRGRSNPRSRVVASSPRATPPRKTNPPTEKRT